MASFPADHQKSQRSVAPRLPAYLLSSRSLDIPYDSPMATVSFTSQRDSSPNSCRKDANRKKKTRPLKEDSTGGIPTRGEVLLQNSLNESSLPYTVSNRAVNYEQAYFPPSWYNYRHISACSSASAKTCCSSNFDQKLENLAQPLSIAVPSDTHSDGYATGSASHSWGNSDATSDPLKLFFSDGSGNFELNGSPVNDLPPPAYADSPQPPERYSDGDQDVSHIQHINETVSDFFSQSASCSDSSEESSPEKCEQKFSREDNLEDELVLEKTQNSLARITPAEGNGGGAPLAFQKYSVTSSVSSTRSPIAKRGRFVSKDTNIVASLAVSYKRLLNFQRYSNEFAKDTYMWLSHQELNVHAIDPKFMFAQKSSGTSFEDRRLVLLKATSEMKKRKHSMEAIHLGAYILDKCLDSFHISKEALADVCAVSMVLGTKMEEYDSLQPGTVNGLVGASSDKTRLCDIEKRIVYEMANGFCFPTPLVYANYMLVELNCTDEQIRFAHYLLDLALLNSRFRDERGPKVAHAAVCISYAVVTEGESSFESECHALLHAERILSDLTKLHTGSTRNIMRGLLYEMKYALQEKHSILIDYLSEDNKRVCFCEGSPALWNLICGVDPRLCQRRNKETEMELRRE